MGGGQGLIGIEIGVAGGEHALSLLTTLDIKKLYLIDPYEMYESYTEGLDHFEVDFHKIASAMIVDLDFLKLSQSSINELELDIGLNSKRIWERNFE